MKITNKMIDDFYDIMSQSLNKDDFISKLREENYEVEEPKSKLDEAREYKNKIYRQASLEDDQFFNGYMYLYADKVDVLVNMYEQAIEEIQEQKQLPEYLKDWLLSWDYEIGVFGDNETHQDSFNMNELCKFLGIKDKS